MQQNRGARGTRQSFKKGTKKNAKKKTKKMKKAKLEAVATMRETWQILSNLYNLCLLFSCEKKL